MAYGGWGMNGTRLPLVAITYRSWGRVESSRRQGGNKCSYHPWGPVAGTRGGVEKVLGTLLLFVRTGVEQVPSTPLLFVRTRGRIGPQHPLTVCKDPG